MPTNFTPENNLSLAVIVDRYNVIVTDVSKRIVGTGFSYSEPIVNPIPNHPKNTTLHVTALPSSGKNWVATIRYNRMDLADLPSFLGSFPQTLTPQTYLNHLNDVMAIALTLDELEPVTIPAFEESENFTVLLQAKADSYRWIGSVAMSCVWLGPGPSQFYTSALYSVLVEDSLNIELASVEEGLLRRELVDFLTHQLPEIQGGTLTVGVAYQELLLDEPSKLVVGLPAVISGTLNETIVYKEYSADDGNKINHTLPVLLGGTLEITISYVSYDSAAADPLTIQKPTITSGTLV